MTGFSKLPIFIQEEAQKQTFEIQKRLGRLNL